VSPFVAALAGGILGGIASGLVLSASVALFGRRMAAGVLHQQVADLEARFRENVVDVVLGRIASFLDQGERIGQIVKRVLEIVQLLLHRGAASGPAAVEAVTLAQQGLRDVAAVASKAAAAR